MKISLQQSVNVGSRLVESLTRNILAHAGGVVAVVTIISMVTSKTFRGWIHRNPYPIFIALIAAIAFIMILLNQLRESERKLNAFQAILPGPIPTEHDRQLYLQFANALRVDSKSMRWLKQEFSPESLPWEPMHALEEAVRKLDLNPVGFDDQSIDAAYSAFRFAVANFQEKVHHWAKPNARNTAFDVPDEWRFENKSRYQEAINEIRSAREVVVQCYDEFFHVCHRLRADDQPQTLNPA